MAISLEHARTNRLVKTSQFYCFEESEIIYDYHVRFLVREDFPYVHELNGFIREASASGLIEKWRLEKIIRLPQRFGEFEFVDLSLYSYFGILFIVIPVFFVVLSILVLEKVVYKKSRKPNASRIWVLLEIFIDADRHFMRETKLLNGNHAI